MAQNIYDDPEFFQAYCGLPRSARGLDAAPEWPALRALVGEAAGVAGRRVVDLGCGFGWFCRWAADAGAAEVLGIDLSRKMLAAAEAATSEPAVRYERQDLDALRLPTGAFDLAYSSLTLHYLADLDHFFPSVHEALVAGGSFVCSVEHPIYTAPSAPAFVAGADGRATWPVDRYLDEGPRVTDWLAPGVVKQHRTITTYVRALRRAGFELIDLDEWGPTADQVAATPEWAVERDRPPFLLIAARRR